MFRYISRLALFLSLSPTQAATIAPRIPGATITLSTISGNGCPSGSVTLTDTRGDMATLNYKQFTTSLGPDVSSASKTKNCLARIKIATPPGYIVSIKDTKYEGRAELSAGATMLSQTTYYFADDPAAQSSTQDRVQGPVGGGYARPVEIGRSNRVYTACGGGAREVVVAITTRHALTNSTVGASGSSSLASQSVGLEWVAC